MINLFTGVWLLALAKSIYINNCTTYCDRQTAPIFCYGNNGVHFLSGTNLPRFNSNCLPPLEHSWKNGRRTGKSKKVRIKSV